MATIYALFPNLQERARTAHGTRLSGGEQQMLAIARILRTGARMLLLDEPTEGLAPVIVQQIGRTIREIKNRGFTVLLVEQNFRFAATVADRHYVMEHGKVVDMIPNADARSQHGQAARISGRLIAQYLPSARARDASADPTSRLAHGSRGRPSMRLTRREPARPPPPSACHRHAVPPGRHEHRRADDQNRRA